jgi:GH24 family phage-related lysozyme (muramidase)
MAMEDTERLVVALEARVRDFERNMAKASGTAGRTYGQLTSGSSRAARQMERDFTRSTSRINQALASTSTQVGSFARSFGGGFLAGAVGGGAAGLISTLAQVASSVATIGDEAKRAGLSVETFQELKYVAEQNRLGVDSLVDGIKELNLRADEWIQTGGGAAAEAFQRLGYDATTLKEKLKDPSALFTEIIGKLGELDKAAQIRIADEVFGGTGGEKFVQLIDQGEQGIRETIRAAHDLGVVLDEETIQKADELDRKFNAVVTTVGSGLKWAIVEAADALTTFIDRFREIEARQTDTIQTQLAEQERSLASLQARKGTLGGFFDAPLEKQIATTQAEIDRLRRVLVDRTLQTIKPQLQKSKAELEAGAAEKGDRLEPSLPLPDRVDQTPTRRIDPFWDDPEPTRAGSRDVGSQIGNDMAAAFIKQFEGFRKNAYWDVNAFRVGYGSDTTTGAGGGVGKVTSTTTTTVEAANRDLMRRIAEFQEVMTRQLGADTMAKFSEEQLAALTSITYNYGELPDRIVEAITNGGDVAAAIRGLAADNGGVNAARRNSEADLYATGRSGDIGGMVDAWEGMREVTAANVTETAKLRDQYRELGQIGVNAVRGIVDALADGKLEGRELAQILLDVAQQMLTMPSAGGGAGAAGGGGGLLASLLSGLGGIFGFAEGGVSKFGSAVPVAGNGGVSDTATVFGEAGPEAAVPLPDGRRIPVELRRQQEASRREPQRPERGMRLRIEPSKLFHVMVQEETKKVLAAAKPGFKSEFLKDARAQVVPTLGQYQDNVG